VAPQSADKGQYVAKPGQKRHRDDESETAWHDQPSHWVEAHRLQGIDLFGHLHRGDLRRNTRARSSGHNHSGDQWSKVSEMCDDYHLGTRAIVPKPWSCETPRNPMIAPISKLAALVTSSPSAPIS
jgi:hypothetical protein